LAKDDSVAQLTTRPRALVLDTSKKEYQQWGSQLSQRHKGNESRRSAHSSIADVEVDEAPPVPVRDGRSKQPDSVESWLDSLNCGRYSQLFIDNGFDDLDFVKDVDAEDLSSIGVSSNDVETILAGLPKK